MSTINEKRILIVLYAGDYYDAYCRWVNNLGEAYHHHNYALHSIAQLAQQDDVHEVAVLSCATGSMYDHALDLGFRVIGLGTDPHKEPQKINAAIAAFNPTHIVLRFPTTSILKWGIRHGVRISTLLADSFNSTALKSRFAHFRLAQLLNHPLVEWVGNHHLNSCLSLQKIGVDSKKIIPWDWPCEGSSPLDFEPKQLAENQPSYTFSYVGTVSEAKGVGDLIEALALLKAKGINAKLNIAGRVADDNAFEKMARSHQVEDSVAFLGLVPNDKVIHLMRDADIVFVPSRHCYPEGLPLTIYEALCSRTPIVASDHPMFLNNIEDGYSALTFPEKNPKAIAACVEKLLGHPDLYFQLSDNAYAAWKKLQISVTWADFIQKWVAGTPEDQNWIQSHALSSGLYDHRFKQQEIKPSFRLGFASNFVL